MSKSGVYLVSSKPKETTSKDGSFDNPGFTKEEKVSYSPENGVDVPTGREKSPPLRPYRGMGKEDLLHFSSQPFWNRLRMICISIIILGWLALIITVVALVLIYPKCRDPSPRSWWQKEAVYRIYVPSFKDSNDDGIGDLKGIESKLDYIKGLGFNIVSLSPFYKTADMEGPDPYTNFRSGNDMAIVDHKDVGMVYGTLEDFDSLVTEANDKDMYIIVDFIPNLTSDKHPWFLESQNDTTNDKKNYYVWSTSTNNWLSVYGGRAWSIVASGRSDNYLHQFLSDTPDLNLRSSMVQQELEDVLTFWMDHGASGFNIRDTSYLYEDYDMRDEPAVAGQTGYDGLDHIYTTNQPEVYGIISRWRNVLRAFNGSSTEKVLMSGLEGNLDITQLYGDCEKTGVQLPLNKRLADVDGSCDGSCITNYINGWLNQMPSGRWPNWVAGDDTTRRLAQRFGSQFIGVYTVLAMLMPGTPVFYYGDEIGLNSSLPDTSDLWTRDRAMRSIMAWSGNSSDVDFCNTTCTGPLWTNRVDETGEGNVESGSSLIDLLKELADLRTGQSFQVGEYNIALHDADIFSFVREFDGETGYLVAVNFSPNEQTRDFTGSHDTIQTDTVVAFAHGGSYAKEDEADASSLKISPYGAVVVSWDYLAKEL